MDKPPIGVLIKSLRESKGLSQRQYALKCGLDRGYISQLEAGKTVSITLRTAMKLAKGLGVPPSNFIDMLTIEDSDIKAFFTNELSELDDESKQLLRHSINIIRDNADDQRRQREGSPTPSRS